MERFTRTPYYTGPDDPERGQVRGALKLGETVVIETVGGHDQDISLTSELKPGMPLDITTPLGIDIVDKEGRPLRANLALQNILGFTEEELQAKQFVDYTYPEDVEDSLEAVKSLLNRENDHISLEKRYVRKDGALIWARTSVAVVRDDRGDFRYFIAMVEDITQRKRMEEARRESEETLRAFMDSSTEGFAVLDSQLNFIHCNDAGALIIALRQQGLSSEKTRLAYPRISRNQADTTST